MTTFSKVERDKSGIIQGMPIPNYRDASRGPRWTQPPTQITTPGNAGHKNPFDRMGKSKPIKTLPGNPVALQTMTSTQRSVKRRKIEPSPRRSEAGQRNLFRQPVLETDVIDIDSEDIGEPISAASTDDLNIIDKPTPHRRLNLPITPVEQHVFDLPPAPPSVAQDGSATKELEDLLESDEIAQFSSAAPPAKDPSSKSTVKQRVYNLEKLVPRVDLRSVAPSSQRHPAPVLNVKSKMKNKNPLPLQMSIMAQDPVLTSSHSFRQQSQSTKSATPAARRLPVSALCIGEKFVDSPCLLDWSGEAGRGRIVISKEFGARSVIGFEAANDIQRIKSVTAPDAQRPCDSAVIALDILQSNRNPGEPRRGKSTTTVTIQFNTSHAIWSRSNLVDFINYARGRAKDKEALTLKAQDTLWEAARMQAGLESTSSGTPPSISSRKLSKRQASLEPIDDAVDPPEPSARKHGEPTIIPTPLRLPPRRSTRVIEAKRAPSPAPDPEEVILVYPPETTGAVNITNADLGRLKPGQYLNDTLIEFGLKRWHKHLQETQPEFADQIHVFSSFFYKKLNKKNVEEGYQSVRKWTSKFDIFKKKYILIPINENFHWYLAIIYQPEHVLKVPDPVAAPTTRRQSRHSNPSKVSGGAPVGSSRTKSAETEETPSENEVNLHLFDCSVTITSNGQSSTTPGRPPDSWNVDREQSTVSRFFHVNDDQMDVDEIQVVGPSRAESTTANEHIEIDPPSKPSSTRSTKSRASDEEMSTAPSLQRSEVVEETIQADTEADQVKIVDDEDEDEEDGIQASDLPKTTFIFTLDSLGSRHVQVWKQLRRYLKLEAQDKLGVSETSDAKGRHATVPVQPNYCDCGVYLLHFARTFMSNPDHYSARILSPGKGRVSLAERRSEWKHSEVEGLRDELSNDIQILSSEWREARAAKDGARKQETGDQAPVAHTIDSSDDEVNIVEAVISAKAKGKGKAAPTQKSTGGMNKALRLR